MKNNTLPTNIAIVSDAVYPFNKGGKEKRIYDITTRLAADGNHVTIYCMKWWDGNEKTIVQDGVTLHAISPYYPLYAGKRRSIREAIFFALHCLKMVDKDFDVIEVDHMPHLVLFTTKIVCVLKRKKLIATWHEVWGLDYWKEYLGKFAGTLAYGVEIVSSRLPDMIVSVSDHTTKKLRTVLKVTAPITTVPNGLDVIGIMSHAPAKEGADIVFAGRLLSHKNIDVLLRATNILAREHPHISLYIVGEGPEKRHLEALTKKLGIEDNVLFLGFLENHDELYRIMHASRVFVLPSTREGFGIAALEANACGLPVVTINHESNAAKELIVNGENGVVVPLSERNLVSAIEGLLSMKQNRATYYRYAARYSWNNIVSKLKRVYAT